MNPIIAYPIVVLLGYLLGTCNLALLLAKLKHVDLSAGSGNPGASNAMILMGWKAGILVGLHDIGKAALAVALARWLFPELPYAGGVAGLTYATVRNCVSKCSLSGKKYVGGIVGNGYTGSGAGKEEETDRLPGYEQVLRMPLWP